MKLGKQFDIDILANAVLGIVDQLQLTVLASSPYSNLLTLSSTDQELNTESPSHGS
jgi:hypothetical protein